MMTDILINYRLMEELEEYSLFSFMSVYCNVV